jgi:hypothetical protein
MTATELLSELRQQGVQFCLENDQFRCRAPKGLLTQEISACLAQNREQILTLLRTEALPSGDVPIADVAIASRRVAQVYFKIPHGVCFKDTEGRFWYYCFL